MRDAVNSAGREDAKAIARRSALRRAERRDMVVATTLLALLIFGWAIHFAPLNTWPRGDFFIASASRHV
jgi:hypothetical protein